MTMSGDDAELTPKRRLAIEALAIGLSPMEAAKRAGVNRSTLYRWRRDPAFAAELRRVDAEAMARLGRGIMALSSAAIVAIARALQEGQPMAVRLRAAQLVAERGPALVELTSLADRVTELEQRIERGETWPSGF